jgi:hypothetical protein
MHNQAQQKVKYSITTFMIANDPYLQKFVNKFTESIKGKLFYTGLKGLGEMILKIMKPTVKKNKIGFSASGRALRFIFVSLSLHKRMPLPS